MTQDERQQLKALYVAMALYFDQRLPDGVLALYIEDLADLPFEAVVGALKDLRRDPKTTRCPLPSVVRAKLTPESNPESEALLLAGRIVGLVSRIGPYNSSAARLAMGPVAWEVVQMEGGWESVCQSLTYDNMPILKSQWRNAAKALLERGKPARWSDCEAIEDKRTTSSGLVNMSDLLKTLPGAKVDL